MGEFTYRAAPVGAVGGAALTGRIDAADESAARRSLREQGLVALELKPVAMAERLRLGFSGGRGVRAADRLWFFRTLDRFMERRAPLEDAVAASVSLAGTPALRDASEKVLEELRQGRALDEACAAVPGMIHPRHAALLRVGHASGRLPRATALVARSLESAAELRRKIIGQLIYPAIVLLVAFVCVWILAAIVVPRIAEQLSALGQELPGPTRLTLAGTRVFVWLGPLLVVLIGGLILAWTRGLAPASLRDRAQRLLWRAPITRDLLWNARGGGAAETLATLLDGGGDLLEGFDLALDAAGDTVIHERLSRSRTRVREGEDAANVLLDEHVLPPEPAALLQIGSRSGDLQGGLQAAADMCAAERETLAARLTQLINPAVMLLMGAVVGWLFYSLLAGMLAIQDSGSL